MSGREIKWGIREELFRWRAQRQPLTPQQRSTMYSDERRDHEPNKAPIRLTREKG